MKITFVLPDANLSGGTRVIAIYAEKLKNKGHEVCVVSTPRKPISLKTQFKSLVKGNGWLKNPQLKPSHLDNVNVLHRVIDSVRPITEADVPDADVVIATWWETAEWVASFSEKKGAKAYFVQHHEVHEYLPKERVKATYSLPLHKITISQWLVDLMKTQYGDRNVSLVPNSVDLEQFYAVSRTKQHIPTIGMMYSTITWKGCDISLKAFDLAAQEIPNLRLIAFGKEAEKPDLPFPSGTKYTYQPPQNQIKDLYAQCDAWLFGSRVEGFGLPILEAMACRTPVIGTPAGAAPELLIDGGGILVKPENPKEMAKAIVQICQLSENEWRAMSDLAYLTAKSYTWDSATELFETALNNAINKKEKISI